MMEKRRIPLVFFLFRKRDMNRRHAHKAYTGVYGGKDYGFLLLFDLHFRTAFMRGTSDHGTTDDYFFFS